MRTGFIISGTGHMALILWLLLGGLFARVDEPEFTATDAVIEPGPPPEDPAPVADAPPAPEEAPAVILSESDFALLSQPGPPPEDPAPAADAPPAPEEAPPRRCLRRMMRRQRRAFPKFPKPQSRTARRMSLPLPRPPGPRWHPSPLTRRFRRRKSRKRMRP